MEGDDAVAGIGYLDEGPGEELAAGGVPPDPHHDRPPAPRRPHRRRGGREVVVARAVGDEEPHGGGVPLSLPPLLFNFRSPLLPRRRGKTRERRGERLRCLDVSVSYCV